jgi:hypothetical protein
MTDVGISALATWLGPIILVGSAVFASFKWGGGMIDKSVGDLETKVGLTTGNLDYKVRNTITRVDALEHVRASDIERIVKLETALQSVERSMERLEKGQDKLEDTINDRFDQLLDRIVTARP